MSPPKGFFLLVVFRQLLVKMLGKGFRIVKLTHRAGVLSGFGGVLVYTGFFSSSVNSD